MEEGGWAATSDLFRHPHVRHHRDHVILFVNATNKLTRSWNSGLRDRVGHRSPVHSGSVGLRGFALAAAAVSDFGPEPCCCLMVTQLLQVLGQVAGRG